MNKSNTLIIIFFLFILTSGSSDAIAQIFAHSDSKEKTATDIKTGAEQITQYLPLLQGKNVAIVANQTSVIKNQPLPDTLVKIGVHVIKVFAPEHGFYGNEDAGEKVKNEKDKAVAIKIISLYGKHKKPTPDDLKDVDVVIYDLQDVGVRFYTFISTLHLIMESCAENKKKLLVLDRPDPNGFYVDGPVLEPAFKTFSGMDPVPVVYGMTPAEYAMMLNGERWLENGEQCDLTCIAVAGYEHSDLYDLPVKPSPNLPNMASIYLYPSLALFEGTVISVGRGTDFPFQVIGCPNLQNCTFNFTPESKPGASDPLYKGQNCCGYDLRDFGNVMMKNYGKLYLFWLKGCYKNYPDKDNFFNNYFNDLAGNDLLQKQIKEGDSEDEIHRSWQPALEKFKEIRKKYLLYKDF